MKQLSEENFYTFKMNISSGRQNALSIAGLLRVLLFCKIFFIIFVFFAGNDIITLASIRNILNAFIVINYILTIIFSFKRIYMNFQKFQYIVFWLNIFELAILTIALGGISIFNPVQGVLTYNNARNIIAITSNLLGILVFIVALFIFRSHALKGYYTKEGKGTTQMKKNEHLGKFLLPICISLSIIAPVIIKQVIPDTSTTFILMGMLFILLGYAIYIGAAWTSMTLYCKLRFKSFNPPVEQITKETENYK
ncbi:hypothetical protein [Enterococcus crotali]|uniref:hypothetical protein n=1 Tax=Enterococcus crotali TaxID=1453587 RepID=UPI000470A5EC|nr:hypothetical protein [Enterococcus crotali]